MNIDILALNNTYIDIDIAWHFAKHSKLTLLYYHNMWKCVNDGDVVNVNGILIKGRLKLYSDIISHK